jgi:hypothetical protein
VAGSKRSYLAFGEKYQDAYSQLGKALNGATNAQAFMLALSWGYRMETKAEDFKRSNNGARIEYLKDEDLAIIAAIHAAQAGDPDAVLAPDAMFDTAEQYAEGGIRMLGRMMDEPGDFALAIASEIRRQLDQLLTEG